MSETTPNLALPLIAAGQAQKHVTHNEALAGLDTLVQLAYLTKDRTAPPAAPAEGDRYLLAAPNPTGAWAGLAGQIVRYQDGAWIGFRPRTGWLAFVVDEADLYTFAAGAWVSFRATLTALQNLTRLGIGTTADATNRLAVKSDAALFSWDEATPGSGDMRVTLNKKAPANETGLVFQDGFSTRASLGLFGTDQFTLKVSPDGAAYAQALTVDPATGCVGLNLTSKPVAGLHLTTMHSGSGAGVVSQDVQINSYSGPDGTYGPVASFVAQVARGTPAAPAPIIAKDRFFGFFGAGWRDGGHSSNVVAFNGFAEEDFTPTANGTGLEFQTTALGATSRRATVKFRANGTLELAPQAAPPAQGLAPGQLMFDSTATAFKGYDGARWTRLTNRSAFAATTNSDNYLPADAWTKIGFNSADSNDQGVFNADANRFVAPEAGLYEFAAALGFKRNGSNAPSAFQIQSYRNGSAAARGRGAATSPLIDGVTIVSLHTVLKLEAGDTVEIVARLSGADGYAAAADSLFAGSQVAAR